MTQTDHLTIQCKYLILTLKLWKLSQYLDEIICIVSLSLNRGRRRTRRRRRFSLLLLSR